MNCAEIRGLLLDADRAELDGTAESDLGRHLHGCSSCRELADLILTTERALAIQVESERPATSVESALEKARQTASAGRRRRAWRVAAPTAAAAGLAGLLVFGSGRPNMPGEIWEPPPARVSAGVEVEAPPGRDVAVFDIEDQQDIVVVWFFDQGDEQ
jgi:predicted anti-sigma-YlaC factor YlaD